ncbi:MAG: Arylamine N-acetyltransferase [Pseudomonas citronellolis]|nr:MAG: Arylamine N-acetyltransferase [Pseudomonas citronellolis]
MSPLQPFSIEQLGACLQRLGLPAAAPVPADRANLDRLIAAALQHLPFENLDVLLERPVDIHPDAVFAKVVERRRGGYCFELNSLFARLLVSLGYDVRLLVGRVRWGVVPEVPLTQQSHLLLRVELPEGPHLVDVGFGGANPPRALPLRLEEDLGDGWRLLPGPREGEIELGLDARSGRLVLYRFTLLEQEWLDYEPRNWFTATHPQSVFRRFLKVAISDGDSRLTLNDGVFVQRGRDGEAQQTRIDGADALLALLRERFRLSLPPASGEALRERLVRLLAASA